ncbi:MAG: hypothetical protein ACI4AN_04410, partial [Muribaculaceae bacterium]
RVFIGLALVGCRAKALISLTCFPSRSAMLKQVWHCSHLIGQVPFAPDCSVKSIAPRIIFADTCVFYEQIFYFTEKFRIFA